MPEPNPRQRELIESTEGIHLVDAGAGTGKTFALTRRYASIVDQPDVDPDDVLLATFTTNAAAEMRERVVANSTYGTRELRDAPIQTFHSRCHDLLLEHGFDAPTHLGIDDRIADATRVVDDDLVEREEFRRFVERFRDEHPEYRDLYRVVADPGALLDLLRELAAKGVFPTAEGWYRDGEAALDGDLDAFRDLFEAANAPRNGGRKQSPLREALGRYGRTKCYLPDAPGRGELRGDGKAVPESVARRAFEDDRAHLKAFVHDLYHGYLAHALSRNYLTFGMLQGYAYVLLCEDRALRDELAFDYVMVDEFQDTSEIQFELALLSCGTDNLCVVGDWKQSIYGFQYAAVENILDFEDRLARFTAALNDDGERVGFDDWSVTRIELDRNYRSTQAVLDVAEEALVVPASGSEDVAADEVRDRVVSLRADTDSDRTRVEAVQHADEHEALLTKVQSIVGNEAYAIEDDGEVRAPTYGDIAVLTRTTAFGRELLQTTEAHDVPMAYEGGVELFRTDQAKLVLAWLRILERDGERGWAVVLERAGYAMGEIAHALETGDYPEAMVTFHDGLAALDSVGAVAERVLARYGYDGTYADVVVETLQDAADATTMTRGDLVRFVERGIETGATREVSAPAGTDTVTVQTIHAAKGLEYPIVVLANMNRHAFPPSGGGSPVVSFDDPVGLRQRKRYSEATGRPHVFDDWRSDVLRACLPSGHDEERRLLYVAMTRAEHHLVFTAGEEPNTFLEELPVDVETLEPDIDAGPTGETVQSTLDVAVPLPEGPVGRTPHELMSEEVFEDTAGGRGTEFGARVHDFAEALVEGEDPDPGGDDPDWEHVRQFVAGLDGTLHAEQDVVLPLDVDGETVAISGVVDLVAVTDDRVRVVDFKTDQSRRAAAEYRKQLSVYWHVLAAEFPDRDVVADVFWTHDGESQRVEAMDTEVLGGFVRARSDR